MKLIETRLLGCLVIEPAVFSDQLVRFKASRV